MENMKSLFIILMLLLTSILFSNTISNTNDFAQTKLVKIFEAPPPILSIQIEAEQISSLIFTRSYLKYSNCPIVVSIIPNMKKGYDIKAMLNEKESYGYYKSKGNYKATNAKLNSWLNEIQLKC
jgi:hypothetical protein